MNDFADDAYRVSRGGIHASAHRHVEILSDLYTGFLQRLDGLLVRDRGDQGARQILRQHLRKDPRGITRTVAMVSQHNRLASFGGKLLGLLHAVGNGQDFCRVEQIISPAPDPVAHIVDHLARQFRVAVAKRLDGHARVRHVCPRKAEQHIDEEIRFASLPDEGTLNHVHPWRSAGPLQHGG
ncbi:hypothetical protein D3C72_1485660 [compost metagenome]